MGTRGGETRDTERQSLTLLPPPERRVPRRTPSNGEWGWAGNRRQDYRPPERRPFREPWWVRGLGRPWRSRELGRPWRSRELGRPWRSRELGWPWRIGELGRPWRIGELGWPWWDRLRDRVPSPRLGLFGRSPTTPPKHFLGENRGYIGHLGAHWRRGLLGALGKRGLLGALGKHGLLGVLGKRRHLGAHGKHGFAILSAGRLAILLGAVTGGPGEAADSGNDLPRTAGLGEPRTASTISCERRVWGSRGRRRRFPSRTAGLGEPQTAATTFRERRAWMSRRLPISDGVLSSVTVRLLKEVRKPGYNKHIFNHEEQRQRMSSTKVTI